MRSIFVARVSESKLYTDVLPFQTEYVVHPGIKT